MKRIISFSLAIMLLLSPVLSIASTWREAFASLTDKELLSLYEAVQEEVKLRGLNPQAEPDQMVWVPRSGSKYHKISTCSNMKNPREVPLSYAISCGFEPCKKCKP